MKDAKEHADKMFPTGDQERIKKLHDNPNFQEAIRLAEELEKLGPIDRAWVEFPNTKKPDRSSSNGNDKG